MSVMDSRRRKGRRKRREAILVGYVCFVLAVCLGASSVDSLILLLHSHCEKLGKCEKPA